MVRRCIQVHGITLNLDARLAISLLFPMIWTLAAKITNNIYFQRFSPHPTATCVIAHENPIRTVAKCSDGPSVSSAVICSGSAGVGRFQDPISPMGRCSETLHNPGLPAEYDRCREFAEHQSQYFQRRQRLGKTVSSSRELRRLAAAWQSGPSKALGAKRAIVTAFIFSDAMFWSNLILMCLPCSYYST